jgi:hypothetical protein
LQNVQAEAYKQITRNHCWMRVKTLNVLLAVTYLDRLGLSRLGPEGLHVGSQFIRVQN